MTDRTAKALIGFVGDVFVDRDHPSKVFSEVREILSVPDILFANLEGVYTDDPHPVPTTVGNGLCAPAHNLNAFTEAGFSVMSLANNHILDVGYETMLENRARLRSQGIVTCGAGEGIADAREPAMMEVDGLSIAFLAYASVFPMGYEARSNRAGLAPMRAYNFWREPYPTVYSPGLSPLVSTVPDQADLAHLGDDIRRAKARADLVITSFHWGDMFRPFHLTDHETRTARHSIDQGADMVIGHHHHALRGMEWYRGKPIMYGLGHFVFDQRVQWTEAFKQEISELFPGENSGGTPYAVHPREGWPFLPMHEDTRMTCIAWATADRSGIVDIGLLPCRITADGLVHPLRLNTLESDEVLAYFDKCNKTQRLKVRIVADDAPIVAGFHTLRVTPG